jgi:iron only hydrogenase large subunit-like protein
MKGPKYNNYLFLDFLSCKGGCIGGPGMDATRTIDEKTERILKYIEFARRDEKDLGRRGKIIHVDDIDFSRKL